MGRLFKEVFKSLARNKITLICLTILIFLTSGIFTLFFDVKTSYSNTINSYDRISRLHDLTTDLDVNPTGNVPNGGFDQIDDENKFTKKPYNFGTTPANNIFDYSLTLPKNDRQYIQLKDKFGNLNISDGNKYIKTEDFMKFYYASKNKTSGIDFSLNKYSITNVQKRLDIENDTTLTQEEKEAKIKDLKLDSPIPKNRDEEISLDQSMRKFSLGSSYKFKLYKKENGKFVPYEKEIKTNELTEFTFKKELKLKDIANIVYSTETNKGKYLTNPRSLFLNTKTKEASLDIKDYDKWKASGVLQTIKGSDFLKALGFEEGQKPEEKGKWYYNSTLQANSDIKLDSPLSTKDALNDQDKLINKFTIKNYLSSIGKTELINKEEQFETISGGNYLLPEQWIRKRKEITSFNWYRYKLNWNEQEDESKSNWKGSHLKFISNYRKTNPLEYEKLKYFSVWNKIISTYYYNGIHDGSKPLIKKETKRLDAKDLDTIFDNSWKSRPLMGPNNNVDWTKYNWKNGEKLSSIRAIEEQIVDPKNISKLNAQYLSNNDRLKETQSIVRDKAREFARNIILEKIKQEVGKLNVGIRQTLTVESVDEKTNKKNVYHFINTGDRDNKIYGTKQEVGKLKDEQTNPSVLNSSIQNTNTDDFLLKPKPGEENIVKKIPSVYVKEIIKAIFEGYTPDPNYFAPDIRFADYYDYYPNTKIPRLLKSQKLLTLTNTKTENKTNVTVAGAVSYLGNGKYTLLARSTIDSFSNEEVWKKVLVNNKEYLTLEELYDYLVKNELTIKGEIGKNGWAYADPKFKNSFSLPIAFGSINNEFVNDIIQNKSIASFVEAIKKVLLQTNAKYLFDKNVLDVLFNSLRKAFEDNNYHVLLSTSKSNSNILTKVIFDTINNIIKNVSEKSKDGGQYINWDGNSMIKNIFNHLIDHFKEQYINSGSTDDERAQKLIEQLDNFSSALGINFKMVPYLNIKTIDLIKLFKNKEKVFDFLKDLIDSIDFVKWSNLIQDWYKKYPYKNFTDTNLEYWTLSKHRIISYLFESVDDLKFKNAINELIYNLDFNALLNPNKSTSIYNIWKTAHEKLNPNYFTNPDNAEYANQLKSFFSRLSGTNDPNNLYNNVNEGLSEIINNISISKLSAALQNLIRTISYPIQANGKVYKNYFTEQLDNVDYLSAFISSMVSNDDENVNGKIKAFQDAIIKMLNLSNETEELIKQIKLRIPKKSNSKISIYDILTLLKFAIPGENKNSISIDKNKIDAYDQIKINNILAKINSAIINKTKVDLTTYELEFLQKYALVNSEELSDLEKLKFKLESYNSFINNLMLKNHLPPNGNWDYKFNSDDVNKEIKSYADLAYRSALVNNKSNVPDAKLLETMHSFLAKYLSSLMGKGQGSIIKHTLALYSMWIKLAYELHNFADYEEKFEKNPQTGLTEYKKIKKKKMTYDEISEILQKFLELCQNEKVTNLLNSYTKVQDLLPGIGILGADNNYQSKTLKLALAHAETQKAAKMLQDAFNNLDVFQKFFADLSAKYKALDTEVDDLNNPGHKISTNYFKHILNKHIYEVTYNLGYISSASNMPTHYLESLKEFVKSFIKTSSSSNNKLAPLVSNDYHFDLLYKLTLESSKLPEVLSIFNVPRSILNPLLALSFPQIMLSYILGNNPNDGNLSYIVKKLFSNLNNLTTKQIREMLRPLFDKFVSHSSEINDKGDNSVALDMSYFQYLVSSVLKTKNGKDIKFYDINITQTFKKILYTAIEPITIKNYIAYSDAGSYLAKVNYGYLNKNKKEVYKGDLSKYLKSPIEMQRFIASLPDKYKVRINSIEYLIIGVDSTADYLYPVINEENLQVDTKTQALLYVNQKGFDRIHSAYPTFAIKEYVLLKAPTDAKGRYLYGKSPKELQKKLNNFISSITASSIKKTYLRDETDYLNPERVIRVVTVRKIVDTIRNVTIYSVLLLIILVSFIVFFIIKRYIEARNKVIGILRAQGYTTGEIALSFCAFGWIPTFIGTLSGYITGLLLQLKTMKIFSSYWTLENNTIPFNWLTLLLTILIPLVAISLLIFLITIISVRKKAIELMSGLVEVNVGNVAQKISSIFRRSTIKLRYIASMAINNFWKLVSLLLAFSTTSFISMFFMSSNNTFTKSISKTYQNRNYRYKLNLETPSTEGGPYVTYNKNDLDKYLYVPNDLAGNQSSNGSQLDYSNPNFLRPGHSFNSDVIQRKYDPVVLTKSSLDLLLDMAVELSPWDITYANMPETQRARVIQIFRKVSKLMEATQNIFESKVNANIDGKIAVKDRKKYLADKKAGLPEDMSNRVSFFSFTTSTLDASKYDSDADSNKKFMFNEWDPVNQQYLKPVPVSTAKHRQEYRNFLLNAYKKINVPDFFVSFAGIYWNDETNEKYSYAKTLINNKEHKIYGYYHDSKYVRLYSDRGVDLTEKLRKATDKWLENNDPDAPIPLVVNKVTAKILGVSEGSIISGELLNHVDRFIHRSLNQAKPRTNYKYKIIGISDTYINNEFSTDKRIIDKILGFDTLTKRLRDSRLDELEALKKLPHNASRLKEIEAKFNRKYEAFNGILSNDKTPVQTIDTLTTYSTVGFWGAAATFDVANATDEGAWQFFKSIFISNPSKKYVSVFEHMVNSYNEAHNKSLNYEDILKKTLGIDSNDIQQIIDMNVPNANYSKLARRMLTKFFGTDSNAIYGKDIMFGASFDVVSKDIEVGFISGISQTVNTILSAVIVLSFIISIVILVVITNIMISSNQKAIATFSVLGYTNSEKIFLFFFNFIPIILLACALMVPVTFGIIAIFNKFMITTSQIVLPLKLTISSIILSATVCLSIFTLTSIVTWTSLNKAKAIDTLKGK